MFDREEFSEKFSGKFKNFSFGRAGVKGGLVIGGLLVILLIALYGAMVSVNRDHVGIVFDKFGEKPVVEGRFIVEKGEKGYWREVLMPGWKFFWNFGRVWRYDIEEVPMVNIPEGHVGIVEALDGNPMSDGQILAEDDEYDTDGKFVKMGQKGPRLPILTPGIHPINTKYLKVTTYPAIQIKKGQIGVVIRKHGEEPPAGMVLVSKESNYRGIQKEILHPGTYYLNPLAVEVEFYEAVVIEKGSVGVVTKKVGKIPPIGTILVSATDKYQGIQRELLQPGMYYINPYERKVKIVPAVVVPDGHVGVQIAKTGKSKPVSQLLAKLGERGILENTLPPGLYYLNPYEIEVVNVDTRQQRYEMTHQEGKGDTEDPDAVNFLSNDGFPVEVDVTAIFQTKPQNAPYVVATVGREVQDVKEKIIRPSTRSFARIIGSMKNAEEFIHGETRQQFQEDLEHALVKETEKSKIRVLQILVRLFDVPQELRAPITQKVIALKLQERYEQEQKTEEANAQLARQKELVNFESEKTKSETDRVKMLINADMKKQQSLIEYQRKLETAELEKQEAKVRKETADIDAERIKVLADAEAYKREKILKADNALEQKLQASIKINQVWAEAFKERKVPMTVFGGNGAGEINQDASMFQQMVNAMIAKQLAFDPSVARTQETE